MLAELRVENLGIVADLSVVLGDGLTVITGETGAGKTLVVTALELLCGGRVDAGLVRSGASEARVEGRFLDLDGEEVVLARVVPASGRSRGYVNGRLANVAELAEHGAALVELHGQHSHHALLARPAQRDALDRAGGIPARDGRARCHRLRVAIQEIDRELGALGGDARARAREIDLLRFQLEEIEAAGLDDPDEDLTLELEEARLADAVAHRAALRAARDALDGSAVEAVGAAQAGLHGRAPFAELEARLHAAQADLADIAHELRLAAEATTEDPERLEAVRARRQELHELVRKYGATLHEVREYAVETRDRLEALEGYESRATTLEAARSSALDEWRAAASDLGKVRRDAAGPLATAVTEHLHELAMGAARFTIEVEATEPDVPSDEGADRVTFLLAANPGEPAAPLAKVASGGELSRTMLAVRVALSGAGPDPVTLVFDEVDAGLGGEAGLAVGRRLATLARAQQVLCVTHLAQVAAFGDAQVLVGKHETDGRTVAGAALVGGDDRVAELSRMLAGVGDSRHARSHAEELLEAARGSRVAGAR